MCKTAFTTRWYRSREPFYSFVRFLLMNDSFEYSVVHSIVWLSQKIIYKVTIWSMLCVYFPPLKSIFWTILTYLDDCILTADQLASHQKKPPFKLLSYFCSISVTWAHAMNKKTSHISNNNTKPQYNCTRNVNVSSFNVAYNVR